MSNWFITIFEDGRVHLFGNFLSFGGGGAAYIRAFGRVLSIHVKLIKKQIDE